MDAKLVPCKKALKSPNYVNVHIISKFQRNCDCRKPTPGMILQAINEFNINPTNSILIGDKKSDILAGENTGYERINIFIESLYPGKIYK